MKTENLSNKEKSKFEVFNKKLQEKGLEISEVKKVEDKSPDRGGKYMFETYITGDFNGIRKTAVLGISDNLELNDEQIDEIAQVSIKQYEQAKEEGKK